MISQVVTVEMLAGVIQRMNPNANILDEDALALAAVMRASCRYEPVLPLDHSWSSYMQEHGAEEYAASEKMQNINQAESGPIHAPGINKILDDVDTLERELAELNDRYMSLTDALWHIFGEQDRRDYAVQAREIMAELAEAQKAIAWRRVTSENLPKRGEVFFLRPVAGGGVSAGVALFDWSSAYTKIKGEYEIWVIDPPAPSAEQKGGK